METKRFICHLEALPGEHPEHCIEDVCCSIYKKQSRVTTFILWGFLITVVIILVYYTYVYVKATTDSENTDEESAEVPRNRTPTSNNQGLRSKSNINNTKNDKTYDSEDLELKTKDSSDAKNPLNSSNKNIESSLQNKGSGVLKYPKTTSRIPKNTVMTNSQTPYVTENNNGKNENLNKNENQLNDEEGAPNDLISRKQKNPNNRGNTSPRESANNDNSSNASFQTAEELPTDGEKSSRAHNTSKQEKPVKPTSDYKRNEPENSNTGNDGGTTNESSTDTERVSSTDKPRKQLTADEATTTDISHQTLRQNQETQAVLSGEMSKNSHQDGTAKQQSKPQKDLTKEEETRMDVSNPALKQNQETQTLLSDQTNRSSHQDGTSRLEDKTQRKLTKDAETNRDISQPALKQDKKTQTVLSDTNSKRSQQNGGDRLGDNPQEKGTKNEETITDVSCPILRQNQENQTPTPKKEEPSKRITPIRWINDDVKDGSNTSSSNDLVANSKIFNDDSIEKVDNSNTINEGSSAKPEEKEKPETKIIFVNRSSNDKNNLHSDENQPEILNEKQSETAQEDHEIKDSVVSSAEEHPKRHNNSEEVMNDNVCLGKSNGSNRTKRKQNNDGNISENENKPINSQEKEVKQSEDFKKGTKKVHFDINTKPFPKRNKK